MAKDVVVTYLSEINRAGGGDMSYCVSRMSYCPTRGLGGVFLEKGSFRKRAG